MKRITLPEWYDIQDRNNPNYGVTFMHMQDEKRLECDIDDSRLKFDESRSVFNHGNTIHLQTVFLDGEPIALERGFESHNFMRSVEVSFIVLLDDEVDEETRKSPHFRDGGEYNELCFATLQQLLDYKLKGILVSESYLKKRAVYRINHGSYGETRGIFSHEELNNLLEENPGTVMELDADAIAEEIINLIAKGENNKYEAKSFLASGIDYVEYYLQRWYADGYEFSRTTDEYDSCQHDAFVAQVVYNVLEKFPFKRNEYGLLKGTGLYRKDDLFFDTTDNTYRTLEEIAECIAEKDAFVNRPYTSTDDYLEHNSDTVQFIDDEKLDELEKEWRDEKAHREWLGFDCSNVERFLWDWFHISNFPRKLAEQMLND